MKSGRLTGVMSDVSLDGADIVSATIGKYRVAQLANLSWPTSVSLKQVVSDIRQGRQLTFLQFGQLDTQLGRPSADAVNALLKEQNLQARDIVMIGCHGQTVWHEPTGVAPHISQTGDNNQIVARTGITVVGDFCRRGIVLGGQGAPLVFTLHHVLLAHPTGRRMVLNIGGTANLPLFIPGQPAGGYDTDPGNMLMDVWIQRQAGKLYDKGAEWARAGKVILPLLQNMLCDPYFSQPAPKSTGCGYSNYGWLERHLRHFPGVDPRDVQATLAELTVVTISEQVLLSGGCERLVVCGGGSRSPLLMARLAALLPGIEVTTIDAVGISGDDMEALAFAWFAWRTPAGSLGNPPSVTGTNQETVLGAIFPANP